MSQKLFVIILYGGFAGMDFYVILHDMVHSPKFLIVCYS